MKDFEDSAFIQALETLVWHGAFITIESESTHAAQMILCIEAPDSSAKKYLFPGDNRRVIKFAELVENRKIDDDWPEPPRSSLDET